MEAADLGEEAALAELPQAKSRLGARRRDVGEEDVSAWRRLAENQGAVPS